MRYRKLCLIALITLILVISQPFAHQLILFPATQVLAQTPADRKAEADRLLQQGIEQYQTSQFEAALQSWQQALVIYREIKDRLGEEQSLGNLGLAYYALGDYIKAIGYEQQSLTIAREIKDHLGEGQSLGNLGIAYYALGDYIKAIGYEQQSLAIAREIKNRQGEGAALGNLGNAYFSLGDYKKAIEYHSSSLAIKREIKDHVGEGKSLGNLGLAYHALGDYKKAIEYHSSSLAIKREIKDHVGEEQSLGNLGITYNAMGEYVKAIECHSLSLAIAREIKDRLGEGIALGNLGIAYFSLGDYAKAIEYQSSKLTIAREIKDRLGEGNALGNLGLAYDGLGDHTKAIEYHSSSLAIAREINYRNVEERSLGNLGLAYYALGDYKKAIEYHSSSLAIAREINDRNGEGRSLGNLGIAYGALKDYTKMIEYEQQSLAIAREINDRNGEAKSLNNLGVAFQKSGNLKEAEKILRAGIEVRKSIRRDLGNNDAYKVSIFEEQARTYRTLQQVLIAQNKTNDALEISEQGRSRALVDLLNSRLSGKNAVPTVEPTLSLLKQIAKQHSSTLVEYSIIPDEFKIQGKQETNESELYIWVIKPTGEVTFRKADLKPLWQKQNTTLAQVVTTTRDSIGVTRSIFKAEVVNPVDDKLQTQSLQKLHQLLIEPIADLLPSEENQRVIFVPQRDLFLVPFPALQDKQGKYLIAKHTILTAPSIQVLDLTRQQRQKVKLAGVSEALVLGNPTMPSVAAKIGEKPEKLQNLPGAKREAQAIAPLLNTTILTGDSATKAAVLARIPKARIIHLATHGIFDDFQGLQSAIALAPTATDNGLLTAEEILQLKLNAELVVLSACNTGRGRITGDGVIGLSRSLITAGAPSVIVSLWSVNDNSTSLLMTEFYQNLQKFDKATALRKAMLTTQKKYQNPLHWAAFTLIGESE
ncbi:tetratricopeptide repeat protein [Nostoc sp. CENA67]|uniref:Tetratricopeptide repeat protein n=1 Tax=Amazonocrinis nigriterrae CENA67 TaxID=2794033 RepID=A0A8J7L9S8_9NOST|nr:CHAT domain-containing tetratricopeptide repeat protein [Amazonocrinis nigriterrae]MBH8565939.1 tetratricopeptide repeat protein [Amazonocrinis nigriterrae CENA67]